MKLFFRKYGSGQPLIILHGLFGQSDNWNTLAKQFSEHQLEVYTVDLRNHGHSPWSDDWNYPVMSKDILEFIYDHNLQNVILLGHSLGGKVAMQFAFEHPDKLSKLIVVDIAPRDYPPIQDAVIKGLLSVDLSVLKTRKKVVEQLSLHVKDAGTKLLLSKNLFWKEEDQLGWRFNLKILSEKYETIAKNIPTQKNNSPVQTLFIRGENSNYISESDKPVIFKMFPKTEFATVKNSGHWIHADKPNEFFEETMRFIG